MFFIEHFCTEADLFRFLKCKFSFIRSYTNSKNKSFRISNLFILHICLLNFSTGSKWKARRRMLTPSFHFNILKDFLVSMNCHASTLKEKLFSDVCDKDKPTDVFPYITLNSLDMICGMCWTLLTILFVIINIASCHVFYLHFISDVQTFFVVTHLRRAHPVFLYSRSCLSVCTGSMLSV